MVYWIYSNQNIFSDFVPTGPEENISSWLFLIGKKKIKRVFLLFLYCERREGSKSGCFSPWKFQFCENCLFSGQASQRESPASPSANISTQCLELIQRSFTPLDIFIVDLNKLWTGLFWQEHAQSGNLKINPDLEPSTALQSPWWYIGMSLSERWWGDLVSSLARGYSTVCWNKKGRRWCSTSSVLRPLDEEFSCEASTLEGWGGRCCLKGRSGLLFKKTSSSNSSWNM